MRVTLTPPHLAPRWPAGGGGQRRGGLRFRATKHPRDRARRRGLQVFLASSRARGVSVLTAPPGPDDACASPCRRAASSRKCPSVDRKPENTILENPNTFQLSDKKEESISSNDAGRPGGVWHLGMMCRTFCKIITFRDAIQHLSDLRKE